MDDSELNFGDIYNPIFEKDSKKVPPSTFIEQTDPFYCSDFCILIFGCFMFM